MIYPKSVLSSWDTLFSAGPVAHSVSHEKPDLFRPWDTLPLWDRPDYSSSIYPQAYLNAWDWLWPRAVCLRAAVATPRFHLIVATAPSPYGALHTPLPGECYITYSKSHSGVAIKVNSALGRDRILTNKMKFGNLALNKDLVLRTWSGLLMNEAALPDDWTYTVGVLVGIQPLTLNDPRNGIG
ncbi:hypothetical protein B0H10DRAFT_1795006 [Mycena sp. CBHHK59/15]|nr:hypothetical protein B0H10DRAFT_1795006 [Mycena sp. CBHHK59/15]